ncbi:hypothetical protein N0B31_02935 [Salinirubellus salinus]|uniref:Uncharacterized protein n=1 Tax=Salinirubellus salinus TaxID=1364945 RepID=A0A9E7U5C1_9EURY|nr:hypothetical protein [Salinirubellus salinus]UWM55245.1 hypothetical protein N0B31_02935 [Salinirubellus salinus]
MAPSTRRLLLVLLVSVALFANPVWLFPNEGETRYTYERSELVPQGDDVEYDPVVDPNHGGYSNDLSGVGCESVFGQRTDRDLSERVCAFEQSVADDGPVTVAGYDRVGIRVGYVELDDGYYHRTLGGGNGTATLTLEPLPAEQVLANVSGDGVSDVAADRVQRSRVALRAVVSGEPVESPQNPSDVAVGQVYALGGDYYAAFVTGSESIGSPVPDPVRLLASFVGFVGGLSALLLGLARLPVEE